MVWLALLLAGAVVGLGVAFTGLEGGFLLTPLLLLLGFPAEKAAGTAVFAMLILLLAGVVTHNRLGNIDATMGLLLGLGGVAGAQLGARLLEGADTEVFRKAVAVLLAALAVHLFFRD